MNLTDRLITEIVEKCDGLSITAEQASNILAYLQYGATLARQPAAIDKEASNSPFSNCKFRECDLPGQCRSEGKCHHPRDAAPLDKEASKPADYSQCCDAPAFCSSVRRCTAKDTAAPSGKQDERGALDVSVLARLSAQIFDCPLNPTISKFARAVEAHARAASTSANVAQGAEAIYQLQQVNGAWQDVSKSEFDSIACNYGRIVYTAPPAQTAIADDARDAARYRWLRKEHFPTAENPPLAQVVWKAFDNRHSSDWANMIDGNDLDRAIDAALTAAQSASGDTK